jgi:hypothetical protein
MLRYILCLFVLLEASLSGRAILKEDIDHYTISSVIPSTITSKEIYKKVYAQELESVDPPTSDPIETPEFQRSVDTHRSDVDPSIIGLKLPTVSPPHTNTPATAAGVMPISLDPDTKEVVVLLGLEDRWWDRHRDIWITDFAGKIDSGETKLIAAAREFTEETAGVYPIYDPRTKSLSTSHNPLIELKTNVPHTVPIRYASYLLPMPYIHREKIKEQADILRKIPGNHVEKDDYYWVKLSDVLRKGNDFSIIYDGPSPTFRSKPLNNGDRVKIFIHFWNSILSDPQVQTYLQEIIRLNAPTQPTPLDVLPTFIAPTHPLTLPATLSFNSVLPSSTARISGAGVLPISIDPHTKKVVVLFGDEVNAASHIDGFADFGGSSDPRETAAETAMREFMEETGLAFWENIMKQPLNRGSLSQADILKLALDSKAAAAQALPLYYVPNQGYVTHILPVPYETTTVINGRVSDVRTRIRHNSSTHPFFEKTTFEWIPLEDIIPIMLNYNSYTVPGTTRRLSWRFLGGRDKFKLDPKNTQVLQYLQDLIALNP